VQPASESETAASSNHQPHACAIDIAAQEVGEQNGFQFNPQAAAFQPGQPLPLWAQVIEDIYHTWDFAAFSWQGEERSAPLEDVESSTNIHTLYRTEESRCVVRAQHPEATLEGCIQILESALFAISFD